MKLDALFKDYLCQMPAFNIMRDDVQDEISAELAEIALKYMAGVK